MGITLLFRFFCSIGFIGFGVWCLPMNVENLGLLMAGTVYSWIR